MCRADNHTVMSSTVSLWTARIKDLQDPALVANAVPASAVKALLQALSKLEQQPPLPNAAWQKLVQDFQVSCAGVLAWRQGGLVFDSQPGKYSAVVQPLEAARDFVWRGFVVWLAA